MRSIFPSYISRTSSSNGLYTSFLASPSTVPLPIQPKLDHDPVSSLARPYHPYASLSILPKAVSMSSRIKPTIPPCFEHGGEWGMARYNRLKSKIFRTRRAVCGFPLALRTFIAAKLQKILISFSQKILKCF